MKKLLLLLFIGLVSCTTQVENFENESTITKRVVSLEIGEVVNGEIVLTVDSSDVYAAFNSILPSGTLIDVIEIGESELGNPIIGGRDNTNNVSYGTDLIVNEDDVVFICDCIKGICRGCDIVGIIGVWLGACQAKKVSVQPEGEEWRCSPCDPNAVKDDCVLTLIGN